MLRNILSKSLSLPILDISKNLNVRGYLNIYRKSLNWSSDELENFQVKKIYRLLEYSFINVPFYKRRFEEAGFNYQKFKYLDELNKIPLLTRSDIQNNLHDLLSKSIDINECERGSSSGSTGDPVIYYHDSNDVSASKAAILFFKELGGYKIGDKWMNIWGNPTAVNVDWKKFSSKFSKFIFNETRFPAYKLNDSAKMEDLVSVLLKRKPAFLYGYTNAIFLLAEKIRDLGADIKFVRGIFTTAENLHDYQRSTIEKYIGKVYDLYGSSEISGVATQTVYDDQYYVLSPRVYVEYGDEVDPETGSRKLIITCFNNFIIPYIRYENGDLAVPSSYEKGNKINYQRIKSIEGRESDIIKLPSGGRLVVPSFFGSRMLKNVEGIKQYQIVKKNNIIEINLITNFRFKEEYKNIIVSTIEEYIPAETGYKLVFDQPIILSKNNKFKLFVDLDN